MLFQTLDDKRQCVGIYFDSELYFDLDNFPQDLTRSWRYTPFMQGYRGVEYAEIYALGKTIDECCPDHLRDDWDLAQQRIKAFIKANRTAGLSSSAYCMFDMIPPSFLKQFCHAKNLISDWVISNYKKPINYRHLLATTEMLRDIEHYDIQIDNDALQSKTNDPSARVLIEKVNNHKTKVKYSLFTTRTGRLATTKRSFPLFTLKKEHRDVIMPKNDMLVELDFNGAELRTLLALSGKDQPDGDVHDWNVRNVFDNRVDREDAKVLFFSWLYGSRSDALKEWSRSLGLAYDTRQLKRKYFDDGLVLTPHGRKLECSDRLFVNYLIQSTTADLCYEQFVKVWSILRNKSSEVAFVLHDAIVIDLKLEDKDLIEQMAKVMSQTRFGKFSVNVSIGKNFKDMRKTKISV